MIDFTKLRGSVEITVFRGEKVLAVNNRKYGGFSLPGGKVEPGETFDEAAIRELFEETGVKPLTLDFIAGHFIEARPADLDQTPWYCAGYIASIGTDEPKQNEDGTKPFWTDKNHMIVCGMFPSYYRWWFDLLDKIK